MPQIIPSSQVYGPGSAEMAFRSANLTAQNYLQNKRERERHERELKLADLEIAQAERAEARADRLENEQRMREAVAARAVGQMALGRGAEMLSQLPKDPKFAKYRRQMQRQLAWAHGVAKRIKDPELSRVYLEQAMGTLDRARHQMKVDAVLDGIQDNLAEGRYVLLQEGAIDRNVQQQLQSLMEQVEAGALPPEQAAQMDQVLRDTIKKENRDFTVRQAQQARMQQVLGTVNPTSPEFVRLADVQARMLSGEIENGQQLESEIAFALTGDKPMSMANRQELAVKLAMNDIGEFQPEVFQEIMRVLAPGGGRAAAAPPGTQRGPQPAERPQEGLRTWKELSRKERKEVTGELVEILNQPGADLRAALEQVGLDPDQPAIPGLANKLAGFVGPSAVEKTERRFGEQFQLGREKAGAPIDLDARRERRYRQMGGI